MCVSTLCCVSAAMCKMARYVYLHILLLEDLSSVLLAVCSRHLRSRGQPNGVWKETQITERKEVAAVVNFPPLPYSRTLLFLLYFILTSYTNTHTPDTHMPFMHNRVNLFSYWWFFSKLSAAFTHITKSVHLKCFVLVCLRASGPVLSEPRVRPSSVAVSFACKSLWWHCWFGWWQCRCWRLWHW